MLQQQNNTTIPDFVLGGRVQLYHVANGGLRTGLDAVMLAAFCPATSGQSVLDLGCGVGAAGLCLAARVPDISLTGIDLQPTMVDLARQNATLNGVTTAQFDQGDIRTWAPQPNTRFDHVIMNPPYLQDGTYTPSPDPVRSPAMGHTGQDTDLADWIDAAHRLVAARGMVTMVHRADHIDQIVTASARRFGAMVIHPLWPRTGQPAKRVLVRMIKDRRDPPTLLAGFVLHNDDGSWTHAAQAILTNGEGIEG